MDVLLLTQQEAIEKIIDRFKPLGINDSSQVRIVHNNSEKKGLPILKINVSFVPYSALEHAVDLCNKHGLLPSMSRSGDGICIGFQFANQGYLDQAENWHLLNPKN